MGETHERLNQLAEEKREYLLRNLLMLPRIIIHVQGEHQPAIFQIAYIVLERIDAAQPKLLFEFIERDQAGWIADQVKRQFTNRCHVIQPIPRRNITV